MNPTLQQLEVELTASLADLTAAQTQATPLTAPEKWSIQQIVDHLLLSYDKTLLAFNARLERGTPTRAKPTLLQHLGQTYIITLGRFPSGQKAPSAVYPSRPTILQSGEELTARIQNQLSAFDHLADRAQVAFGCRPAISHVVLGPMPVHSWRRFHLFHGRHHMRQIRTIRAGHAV